MINASNGNSILPTKLNDSETDFNEDNGNIGIQKYYLVKNIEILLFFR